MALRTSLSTRHIGRPALLVALLLLGLAFAAPPAGAYKVVVPNTGNGTVSIIDTLTNTVVASPIMRAGSSPHAAAVAPDGSRAYITLSGVTIPTMFAGLAVLDLRTNTVVKLVNVGPEARGLAVSPDGTKVYVVNSDASHSPASRRAGSISTVDTTTSNYTVTPGGALPPNVIPDGIALNHDGSRLYLTVSVPGSPSGQILIYNTSDGRETGFIDVGEPPSEISTTGDGTVAFVASGSLNFEMERVRLATSAVSGFSFANPGSGPPNNIPTGVATNPTDGRAWFTSPGFTATAQNPNVHHTPYLGLVRDPGGNFAVTTSFPPGYNTPTYGSAITPDGQTAYLTVPSPYGDQVKVLNATTQATTGTISLAAGANPRFPAITPNQGPTAALAIPASVAPGEQAAFDASGSSDSDGSVTRYDWAFGDGQTASNVGATPTHGYASPGTYTVRVTAADNGGCSTPSTTTFTGQTLGCNGKAAATTTRSITIQPRVTVATSGGGSGSVTSSPDGINCPGTCNALFASGSSVTLTATPTTNSVFTGWSGGGCTGTATCQLTPTANTSVTANFAGVPRSLTVQTAGTGAGSIASTPAGIGCPSTCSHNFAHGDEVTLTATPATHSTFTGWSGGGCSGTSTCAVTMDAAKSVTATFAKIRHPLTVARDGTGSGSVSSSPGAISCGATCSDTFDEGDSVTLTATPATHSTFTGWSGGGCSGTGTCTVTIDAAKSVTATFTKIRHNVSVARDGSGGGTVASSPPDIDCGSTCSALFDEGSPVTLSAAPAPHSAFAGWSDPGCTGTGDCILTVDAAKSVTATFTQIRHTLTVARDGTGGGSVSSSPPGIDCGVACSAEFDESAQVTLTATQDTSSVFTAWSGPCSGIGVCTLTLDGAKSTTATFTANPTVTPGPGDGGGTPNPPGPQVKPLQTKISKVEVKKHTATITFAAKGGSGGYKFERKLDHARKFRQCRSPLRLTGLNPGKHTLLVRVHDSSGALDTTPAKATFKIRR